MLQNLNNVWLSEGMYVAGGSQPSIADLLMSCEIEMLRLMDASEQVCSAFCLRRTDCLS